jgi:hypothetical protein
MSSWNQDCPKQLKKVAYALTESTLKKVIEAHEDRGWTKASEIKEHGYGVGCLMIWKNEQLKGVK